MKETNMSTAILRHENGNNKSHKKSLHIMTVAVSQFSVFRSLVSDLLLCLCEKAIDQKTETGELRTEN